MKRDTIIKILVEHESELRSRHSVASMSLFGSAARDEYRPGSDLDFLVSFDNPPGIFGFLELKMYLEELFQCPVDLVTVKALKKQFENQILQEALHAI